MDIDNFDIDEDDQIEAAARREAQLLEDEQPLDFDDDCEACKI